jgi:hypothetical protein
MSRAGDAHTRTQTRSWLSTSGDNGVAEDADHYMIRDRNSGDGRGGHDPLVLLFCEERDPAER